MRKVIFLLLIFSIIAIPIFACGECNGCSSSKLKMLMGIKLNIQQKFEAMARSYDASFCGLTGKAIRYNPLTMSECECDKIKTATYVKLASLDISSNYPGIFVGVSYSDDVSPHLDSKVMAFFPWVYWKGEVWYEEVNVGNGIEEEPVVLKESCNVCDKNKMPFRGTVYVALPRNIGKNLRPGRYTATITFTISPICPCSP